MSKFDFSKVDKKVYGLEVLEVTEFFNDRKLKLTIECVEYELRSIIDSEKHEAFLRDLKEEVDDSKNLAIAIVKFESALKPNCDVCYVLGIEKNIGPEDLPEYISKNHRYIFDAVGES